MDPAEALQKLKEENAAMEEEIAKLTAASGTQAFETTAPVAEATTMTSTSKIRVKMYGPQVPARSAGIDLGSNFRPIQCNHRTVIGGFFTS